jgi:signal transduction histidine kinase
VNVARSLLRPLSATTWRRWVYLVLGGAVLVPYLFLGAYPAVLAGNAGGLRLTIGIVAGLALAVSALALTARLEAVRQLEAVAAKQLVRGPFVGELVPSSVSGADRFRAMSFFALHLLAGGLVGTATLLVMPTGLTLLLASTQVIDISGSEAARHLSPAAMAGVGLGCLVVFAYGTAALGALMGWAAPRLLGRSSTNRLAEMERVTDDLSERNRLARDLHDSVGHALSIVTVQAGAARKLLDTDREFARESLAAVEEAASQALVELDGALEALRDDKPSGRPRTLDDLDVLVRQSEAAGLVIRRELSGPLRTLSEPLSHDAFLVVQEGLGNALRHAGPGPVTIRITVDDRDVRIEIGNPVPVPPMSSRASGGRGLRGMSERSRARGGTVDAREVDGWWRLSVTMRVTS